MGLINIEQLLLPISEATPSGPNLEYDPAFTELERATQGKPEQRMGSVVVPSEPPDWSTVCKLGQALLERTRDLRVAAYLAQGLLNCHGFAGFAEGMELAAGLVRELWTSVHPELDHEDDDDPTMRVTALASLAAPANLLALQKSSLAQLRGLGSVCLRDLRALNGGGEPAADASALTAAAVEALFQQIDFELLQATEAAVQRCIDAVAAVDDAFVTHTGSRGPDLAPLTQLLREVRHNLKPRVDSRRAAQGGDEPEAEAPHTNNHSAPQSGGTLSGEIRSREDVLKAIDRICAYYARAEPASPLPLLLERCRRLVSLSFLEIIQELAPDSLAQVTGLAGRKSE